MSETNAATWLDPFYGHGGIKDEISLTIQNERMVARAIIAALLSAINAQPMAIKAGDVVEHVTGWRDKVISVDRYIVSTENHGSYNQCMIGLVENGESLAMVRAKEAAREFLEGLG